MNKILTIIVLSLVSECFANTTDMWSNTLNVVKRGTDPCEPYHPRVPNFRTPGRRISEAKCYEYIWHLRYRADTAKRSQECLQSKVGTVHIYVIGGKTTNAGDYPHMAAIGWKAAQGTWIFKCGGSLISSKFILTAAHCSKASPRDSTIADIVPKIVRLGDKNILDGDNTTLSTDVQIIRIIPHPLYKSPVKYYDIALMELEHKVEFTMVKQPACLWTNPDDKSYRGQATVTGWGVIDAAGRETPPELQVATLDIIDRKTCDNLLKPICNRLFCGLKHHQLCAGKMAGGVDTCQGDSGGPLQVEISLPIKTEGKIHYVIGVTSFGIGCAWENQPGVYTRVASFLGWIESIVWP